MRKQCNAHTQHGSGIVQSFVKETYSIATKYLTETICATSFISTVEYRSTWAVLIISYDSQTSGLQKN